MPQDSKPETPPLTSDELISKLLLSGKQIAAKRTILAEAVGIVRGMSEITELNKRFGELTELLKKNEIEVQTAVDKKRGSAMPRPLQIESGGWHFISELWKRVQGSEDEHELAAYCWACQINEAYAAETKLGYLAAPSNSAPVAFVVEELKIIALGYLRLRAIPLAGPALVESPWLHLHVPDAILRKAVSDAAEAAGFFSPDAPARSWEIELVGYALLNDDKFLVRPFATGKEVEGASLGGAAALLFSVERRGQQFPREWLISTKCDETGKLGEVDSGFWKERLRAFEIDRKGNRTKITHVALAAAEQQEGAAQKQPKVTAHEADALGISQPKKNRLESLEDLVFAERRALDAWWEYLIALPKEEPSLAYYNPPPAADDLAAEKKRIPNTRESLFIKPTLRRLERKTRTEKEAHGDERGEPRKDQTQESLDGLASNLQLVDTSELETFQAFVANLYAPAAARTTHVVAAPSGHGKSLSVICGCQALAQRARAAAEQDETRRFVQPLPIPVRLAALHAQCTVEDIIASAVRMAVATDLRGFADHLQSHATSLGQPQVEIEAELKAFRQHAHAALQAGRAILFLDGLDESSTQIALDACEAVGALNKANRIVILTRPYGIDATLLDQLAQTQTDLAGEPATAREAIWRLEPMGPDDWKEFVQRYFSAGEGAEAAEENKLIGMLNRSGYLREVTRAGLLLTFACHARYEITKETTLAQLYEQIMLMLLKPSRRMSGMEEILEKDFEPQLLDFFSEACFDQFSLNPRTAFLNTREMLLSVETSRKGERLTDCLT